MDKNLNPGPDNHKATVLQTVPLYSQQYKKCYQIFLLVMYSLTYLKKYTKEQLTTQQTK